MIRLIAIIIVVLAVVVLLYIYGMTPSITTQ